MTNKEFFETSKIEVKRLNGSETEIAQEAWRAGYLFVQQIIRKAFESQYQDEFLSTIEDFTSEELEEFEWNE